MSGFLSKNVQELGSQVPVFLHVGLTDISSNASLVIPGLDLTFGDDSSTESTEWACSKTPFLGTVTKDCMVVVRNMAMA